jgi:tetratricopeptide (TPR) repeat protein
VYERQLGGESLKTAAVLCMTGDVYRGQKNYKEAEPLLKRCAQIREAGGGMVNAELGDAMHSLAIVYQMQGKYGLADPSFKLAEKIREKTQGIMSASLADTLEAHAVMLKQMGRDPEADKDLKLAAVIRKRYPKAK